jgi:hypothetical protein
MPIHKITINEFECTHCGHKWTNRKHGNDGPTPKNCAKCKRRNWNDPEREAITPTENGLRKQIRGLNHLYLEWEKGIGRAVQWDPELPKKFLSIQPRPTLGELSMIIVCSPLHISRRGGYSKKIVKPLKEDPTKPGFGIVDSEKLTEMKIEEAKRRKKLMNDIIKSRNSIE